MPGASSLDTAANTTGSRQSSRRLHTTWAMRLASVVAPLLSVVGTTNGLNSCIVEHRCFPGAKSLKIRNCQLTDEDIPDLAACFDKIGRGNIEIVSFSGNELTRLPVDLFDGFEALKTLNLSHNQLELLGGNFNGASSLEKLNLLGNNIESLLAGDVFDGLAALRSLMLDNNKLASLPFGVFFGLPAMTSLSIQGCNLVTLEAGAFHGTLALQQLKMSGNVLEILPEGLFDGGCSSLRKLYMENNVLTTLPAGIFDGTPALERLELQSNEITEIPADLFKGLVSLDYLLLHGNKLTGLPVNILDGLVSLKGLELGGNRLTTLPAGVFVGLHKRATLKLEGNSDLQCLPPTQSHRVYVPSSVLGAKTKCECPEDPTCDEDGIACECKPGHEGYSCAARSGPSLTVGRSSEDVIRAFSCPAPGPPV